MPHLLREVDAFSEMQDVLVHRHMLTGMEWLIRHSKQWLQMESRLEIRMGVEIRPVMLLIMMRW
jgi:hypothetical protein